MPDLPPLILLVMSVLAVAGVIECVRAIAVLVRDETAIHDLMVESARVNIDHQAGANNDNDVCGVDILDI